MQKHLRRTVKEYREKEGLSRTRFAERAGMTLWMISMFERGDRSLSLEGAMRVCRVLNRKLWEVLKEVEEG